MPSMLFTALFLADFKLPLGLGLALSAAALPALQLASLLLHFQCLLRLGADAMFRCCLAGLLLQALGTDALGAGVSAESAGLNVKRS